MTLTFLMKNMKGVFNMKTFYEVISKSKVGNKVVWEIAESITGGRVSINSGELKVLIKNKQVYNAALRDNKIVEVPHALRSLMQLSKKVGDTFCVHVEYKVVSSSNRVHIKLYNSIGEDITSLVYNVVSRSFKPSQCSLTESNVLSLDNGRRVHDLMPEINNCNSEYGLYTQGPLVDEKLYKYVPRKK